MNGFGKLLNTLGIKGIGIDRGEGSVALVENEREREGSSQGKRTRHPKERPFISKSHWGQMNFEMEHGSDKMEGEKKRTMLFSDLYKHAGILGGSGSGKTFTILNQIFREIFRSTHLPDGPEREKLKPGGLIIEAKGDFPEKLWTLSKLYGRLDDVRFLGPTHELVYDPFSDPTEDSSMKANKMLTLLQALNDGQKSPDPFFDKASTVLFTNIFGMHKKLIESNAEGVEPMSFTYLTMMLSDRGTPKNVDAVTLSRNAEEAAARAYEGNVSKWLDDTVTLINRITALRLALQEAEMAAREILDRDEAQEEGGEETEGDDHSQLSRPEQLWRTRFANRVASVQAQIEEHLLEPHPNYDEQEPTSILEDLEIFQKNVYGFLIEDANYEPPVVVPLLATLGDRIRPQLDHILAIGAEVGALVNEADNRAQNDLEFAADSPFVLLSTCRPVPNALEAMREILEKWGRLCTDQDHAALRWANVLKRKVHPEYGLLKTLLEKYEAIIRGEAESQGIPMELDPILEYFSGTYLNVANDRTSGSVAMTATNMVAILSKAPFNRVFAPNPNFKVGELFRDGKILALDMPFAFYRDSARLAAILLKIDFFRAAVARQALGFQMDRPIFYLVDEFPTIATTGDWTGEAAFFDKCRGSNCACIVAFQSIPMLKKRFPDAEVDSILTNLQTNFYLRNDDPTTNERASRNSGRYWRGNSSFRTSAGEHAFNTNRNFASEAFSVTFFEDYKLRPDSFRTFKVGECLAVLPPEFGKGQLRRHVTFKGEPLNTIENDGYPMPGRETDRAAQVGA